MSYKERFTKSSTGFGKALGSTFQKLREFEGYNGSCIVRTLIVGKYIEAKFHANELECRERLAALLFRSWNLRPCRNIRGSW